MADEDNRHDIINNEESDSSSGYINDNFDFLRNGSGMLFTK